MSKLLNPAAAEDVRMLVLELQAELNLTPEEMIPGLIAGIVDLARLTPVPEQAIDEAVDMLVGGVE